MTDLSSPIAAPRKGFDFASDQARALLKKRYASEARFRFVGLSAIVLAAVFVLVLLADIVRKGAPAFMEHSLRAEVTFNPEAIDPKGTRDLAEIRAGDYASLVRESVRSSFPEVKARASLRRLDRLASSGAGDDLRALVMADPAIIGSKRSVNLLLSSNVDLFLKGEGAARTDLAGTAGITIARDGDSVVITAASPVFQSAHAAIKADLERDRARLQADLARLPPASNAESVAAKRTEIEGQIAQISERIANPAAPLALGSSQQSLLLLMDRGMIKLTEVAPNGAKGEVLLPLTGSSDASVTGWTLRRYHTPEGNRRISDAEIGWITALEQQGRIEKGFSWRFLRNGDSREPELAGIRGALVGSLLTLLVTLVLCLPIGVAAAIYLEEFAPKNRFTDLLEVNINNLAAVPSIVFGLLGLAVFLNAFDLPRSAPIVGGLVLALLVLPTIIIASRAAIRAVPPSIREAALGVGASHQQAVFHHVLPLAMPGIMTGTIIGMAHALGETAPLLMIGMVAFIVDVPGAINDAATVLPVQIFLWSDLPELGFRARTAAAIMVLLVFLFLMNGLAIVLRRRFERRW